MLSFSSMREYLRLKLIVIHVFDFIVNIHEVVVRIDHSPRWQILLWEVYSCTCMCVCAHVQYQYTFSVQTFDWYCMFKYVCVCVRVHVFMGQGWNMVVCGLQVIRLVYNPLLNMSGYNWESKCCNDSLYSKLLYLWTTSLWWHCDGYPACCR